MTHFALGTAHLWNSFHRLGSSWSRKIFIISDQPKNRQQAGDALGGGGPNSPPTRSGATLAPQAGGRCEPLRLRHRFHDARLNPDIPFAYHALAIDERRTAFKPSLWDESRQTPKQTIEQLWFAGSHSDVGGGYAECGLSNCALQWMAHKALARGLTINRQALRQQSYRADSHDKPHDEAKKLPWRRLQPKRRKLPDGAKVHSSAIQRMKCTENKYPLQRYLPSKHEVVD